ncbi:MAG: ribose ABC transporter permease [Phycisphaerales bacterium]|nr:MAG: ribose ABC transporter permease [Phycisphaerales bacterium]
MLERTDYRAIASRFRSLVALLLMVLAFSIFADGFLSVDNLWTVMRQISVNTCLSVGMTLVILTGGFDLSVGSILALSGAIMAGLLKFGTQLEALDLYIGYQAPAAILIGILAGAFLGLFNGVAITRFKVPPFVATLAMLTIARGLTKLYTGGEAITGLGEAFVSIGSGRLLGIPNQVWIAAGIVVAVAVLLKRTRFGRYIYAVGGNEAAAQLSGVNVKRVKLMVYTIAGALSAVGGLIVTSRLNSATPIAGEGFELDSIAAVVIGGTSLSGGKGSVLGTVLGALIIGVLNSGLVIMGVDPFWQTVIKGFVILLAVVVDRLNAKE